MSKREVGLLFIGLGVGLIASVVAIVEFALRFHMFIVGIRWRPASVLLALPFVLIVVGLILIRRSPIASHGESQVKRG